MPELCRGTNESTKVFSEDGLSTFCTWSLAGRLRCTQLEKFSLWCELRPKCLVSSCACQFHHSDDPEHRAPDESRQESSRSINQCIRKILVTFTSKCIGLEANGGQLGSEREELYGVIDFDRTLRDPSNPAKLSGEYSSGDRLHPGPAGHNAMAESIDLKMFRWSW